ncbi:unnamed protein product [Kuraishia capsulata CBS 1993]|uniref:Mitochondrial intermediate peptidase n=1 Tax=Kuraishia capsulata CBS 1993 TaxID=1382522 RepID=W6MSJ7_9ASCO|nr:uncharacterized protein KUCA_T00000731001 [Kuraishia capsulata CBS 1993]CDK24765.1 unnamed protein product [Kuraishia capsulata CBS 1993]
MLRLVSNGPFLRHYCRGFSTTALAAIKSQQPSKTTTASPIGIDRRAQQPLDIPVSGFNSEVIRQIFDDENFWQQFNGASAKSTSFFNYRTASVGLFQNPYLVKPSGLKDFCAESLDKAKALVQHILADESPAGYRTYIRNLDRLSDILCRVIDLAEFVRVAHPNRGFVNAAQECHQEMFQYMNILNTTTALYEKLERVLNTPEIASGLSEEEVSVGELLLSDFKKSGIDMDESTKNDFVELSQQIAIIGQHFNNGLGESSKNYVTVPKESLKDLDVSLKTGLSVDKKENYRIPVFGRLPYEILRTCSNDDVRREVWSALHQSPKQQLHLLDTMLKYRGILARLMGKSGYSEYQLTEKMAKTPENVMSFLQNLMNEIRDDVMRELRTLQQGRTPVEGISDEEILNLVKPWDRDYLAMLYMTRHRHKNTEDISAYLSLGTVVKGLSDLFESIYGISLRPASSGPGETWSPDVRKFSVYCETEGKIGVIYLDLFYRETKTMNPAHFTVCCSRKIYPEELESEDPFRLKLETIMSSSSESGDRFQLPVISVVCNFLSDRSNRKTLLTLSQVQTLFHEMGHAMHSMLGRTNLHNVSGTRCVTDFVELPSILMEHFAKDPRVLTRFARHHETGEPLPLGLLESFQGDNDFLKNCEVFGQIKMALLDQVLHSDAVFAADFDSAKMYHHLEAQLRVFADTKSNWPGKFGHLVSYGSVYYSYLFDRAIASKIWDHLFAEDPLSRANGDKFRDSVLKWGGSKGAWELLADVLDNPELKKGDERAMEFIAKTHGL